ncbi:MAG: 3-isopropylmalate dehydrogenase [Blautia sp.]|nr:3-isopropylmalate dehydrogenase [Blautia sp.]
MKDGRVQWHPAFGAVLRIELGDELGKVQIEEEHLLGSKPMQVDFLVVKVDKKQKIHKNIGKLFRKYNIIEYKSPEESLSINDFYKAYGYACFYQSDTERVMEISPENLGITFVCNHYPRKMLKHIQDVRGITVKKCERGIYELTGDAIPMQLIITHELTKEKNYWMQSLRNDLRSGGEIQELIETYEEKKTQPLYQAVMEVIMQANWKEAEVERKMCEALKRLFAEDIEEGRKRGEREGRKEGRKEGITALVKVAYDWKMPKQEVIRKIVEQFQITGNEAENFVEAYYK